MSIGCNVEFFALQVDPLFTVPAPPPPISVNVPPQILPSYFPPSSSITAPVEQLLVRTRSMGINTCEVGVVTEPECLGPCEPGTSVNLEGIVWHETEEGKAFKYVLYLLYVCMYTHTRTHMRTHIHRMYKEDRHKLE